MVEADAGPLRADDTWAPCVVPLDIVLAPGYAQPMLETPQVVLTTSQPIAFIPVTASWQEMPKVMGPGIAELLAEMTSQGVKPAGEIFTHHLRRPTDTFEFEISIPVASPVQPRGRVQAGEYPAAKMAKAIYQGPYEGLADAWPEFFEWLEKNGHATAEDLWEAYTVGPHSDPNPANWRTELSQRIVN